MHITVQSPQFNADKKLLDYLNRKLSKLGNFYDRILEIQVFLKLENSGRVKDKVVELKLMVPGDILVAKSSSRTFEAAIDNANDVMKRRIKRYKERLKAF